MILFKNGNDLINDIDSVYNFIPKNLEWITSSEEIVYKGEILKTSILLDIIHTVRAKYNIYSKKMSSEGFSISSKLLIKNYGNHYAKYMEYLLDESFERVPILRISKNHLKGKYARKYTLNNFYLDRKYVHHKNSNKKVLKRKKRQLEDALTNKDRCHISVEIRCKLYDDLSKFKIDHFGAKYTLDILLESGKINREKREANLNTVETLIEGVKEFTPDSHGRLHTIITRLKREVRKKDLKVVTEFGLEDTVEFDIPNSQPTMLLFLLKDNLDKITIEDYNSYKEICRSESVYDKIIAYYKLGGINISKKESKNIMYTYLFGPVIKKNAKKKDRKIIRMAFIKIFGESIDTFINDYKNTFKEYNEFSWMLQNYESNIIYNKIVKNIMDIDPSIPIATVHDSIIVPKSKERIISLVFDKHINQLFEDV